MSKKVIVFDFDQTISVQHVFKCLAGYGGSSLVPAPHACSEKGQLYRVLQLGEETGGKFYGEALGGDKRVEELAKFFNKLKLTDTTLYVCSKGLIAPIRVILDKNGLLDFFEDVYGRIKDYEQNPQTLDKLMEAAPKKYTIPPEFEGHLDHMPNQEWTRKAALCHELAEKHGNCPVMLVEDDPQETDKADRYSKYKVHSLLIEHRNGLDENHMETMLRWAENGGQFGK